MNATTAPLAPSFAKKLWLFLSILVFLAGCGGGDFGPARTAKAPESNAGGSFGGSAPAGYPSQPSLAQESAKSSAAPPPASPGAFGGTADSAAPSRSRPAEPAPESRPGLGTEFGESRVSRVHDVTFVRDSSRPFAIAQMNYNDRKGVDALASMHSRRDSGRSIGAGGGAVTISIRDSSGDALEAVHVGDRTFVVGQAGQRYTIVLQNHTSHRFEAVGTVDGLDVINGKPGTFDNRGYVLMPFATLEIEGFRTSTSSVAAFRFASVADSYAAQTGSARNVGVIGIAFFTERGDTFIPENETRMRDTASPFPADPRFAQPPRR
ncbi:MAG: hypothetical protein JST00_11570 [Deltaproteobacteria bacterium]|nr:hypothetical protein [Deltaproteobacteria bacterium]